MRCRLPQPLTRTFTLWRTTSSIWTTSTTAAKVSGDGWNWSTFRARCRHYRKDRAINYAGRGLNYDYEGTNRNVNVALAAARTRRAFPAYNSLPPSVAKNLLLGTRCFRSGQPGRGRGAGYL